MKIPTFNQLCIGYIVLIGSAFIWYLIQIEKATALLPNQLVEAVHQEGDKTRELLNSQLIGLRYDVMEKVDRSINTIAKTEYDANDKINHALTIVDNIQTQLLDKDKGVLSVAWKLESDVNTATNGQGGLVSSVSDLSKVYSNLPDRFQSDRRVNGLIDQSMGLIAASKVTMGQVAISSKEFTTRWPSLLDSFSQGADSLSGIASNGKRVTDKFLTPCLGPHLTAVGKVLARTGCVAKGSISAGVPIFTGLAKSGVF